MSDLAQDLANKLGLKVRKAYISPQTESTTAEGENHGETSPPTGEVGGHRFNLLSKIADIVLNRTIRVNEVLLNCKNAILVFLLREVTLSFLSSDVLQRVGISGRHGTRYHRMLRFKNCV